jgi:hypothetical protein
MTIPTVIRRVAWALAGAAFALAASTSIAANARVDYGLTIENQSNLDLTVSFSAAGTAFDVKPMTTTRHVFPQTLQGQWTVYFAPTGCADLVKYSDVKRTVWVLPNQSNKVISLRDRDFANSVILAQCPEAHPVSAECRRARREVTRLKKLRDEAAFLNETGERLERSIAMPGGGSMYEHLQRLQKKMWDRQAIDPHADTNDPVYRKLNDEYNALHDTFSAQMTEKISHNGEFTKRNIWNYEQLVRRGNEDAARWKKEGPNYEHAVQMRAYACHGD